MIAHEEESLLANRLDDRAGLLQSGDFETTESPGPKQGKDMPPDFLDLPDNGSQRERQFTFSKK